MSRRASFFARQHPGVRRVRFPDEVVFEESIKEADGEAIMAMLRRASVDIDVNRINMAGMTALHQVRTGNKISTTKKVLYQQYQHGRHDRLAPGRARRQPGRGSSALAARGQDRPGSTESYNKHK